MAQRLTGILVIAGHTLPGRSCCGQDDVHVGVQRRQEVVDLVPADADAAVFEVPVEVVDGDWRGPYVHGPRGGRFVYLSWGSLAANGAFAMFRRAKLNASSLPADVAHTLASGGTVTATLSLTGRDGGPLCASIPPAAITWVIQH